MPKIRITKSEDDRKVSLSLNCEPLTIPVDGCFHDVPDKFLTVLDDSAIEYEIENVDARPDAAAAGGAGGLGDSTAPLPPTAPAKAKKAKAKKAGGLKKGAASTATKGAAKKAAAKK